MVVGRDFCLFPSVGICGPTDWLQHCGEQLTLESFCVLISYSVIETMLSNVHHSSEKHGKTSQLLMHLNMGTAHKALSSVFSINQE